jgi:hypothetical protein
MVEPAARAATRQEFHQDSAIVSTFTSMVGDEVRRGKRPGVGLSKVYDYVSVLKDTYNSSAASSRCLELNRFLCSYLSTHSFLPQIICYSLLFLLSHLNCKIIFGCENTTLPHKDNALASCSRLNTCPRCLLTTPTMNRCAFDYTPWETLANFGRDNSSPTSSSLSPPSSQCPPHIPGCDPAEVCLL